MLNLFTNKLKKLERIVKKAIEKAIKYGNKLITLYNDTQETVDKIQTAVDQLTAILEDWNTEDAENEDTTEADEPEE